MNPLHTATLSRLNFLDWLLLLLLVYSIVRAFMTGLLRELASLIGLIAGILFAGWNYPRLALWLHRWIASLPAAKVAAFLLIAAGVMLLCGLVGRILHKTAHAIGLGLPNRLLGALFGALRGCLLGVALLTALTAFLPRIEIVRKSLLAPYFLAGVHAVSFVVPRDLQQLLSNGAEQLRHRAFDSLNPLGSATIKQAGHIRPQDEDSLEA